MLKYSNDHGSTFIPSSGKLVSSSSDRAFGTNMVIGPNGELYIFWRSILNDSIYFSNSSSGTDTFSISQKAILKTAATGLNHKISGTNIDEIKIPYPAINPINGNVFVAYADDDQSLFRIKLVKSTDGGNSWNSPVTLSPPNSENHQCHPAISIDANGRISILYLDVVDDFDAPDTRVYITESYDNGSNFTNPVQVSRATFRPPTGGSFSGGGIDMVESAMAYHYQTIVSSEPGKVYTVWTDYRNISQSSGDIYFSPVDLPPSAPTGMAFGPENQIHISWAANPEFDIQYYEVWRKYYRNRFDQEDWTLQTTTTSSTWTDPDFQFSAVGNIYSVYYKTRAKDLQNNVSSFSTELSTSAYMVFNKKNISESVNYFGSEILLDQNYPNPFNPQTTISFSLKEPGLVTLVVYDYLGREVERLIHEVRAQGRHAVSFDAHYLSAGMYFYKLQAGKNVAMRRMLLIK